MDRDKLVEIALFGEGQMYTARFLRRAMKHRSVILQDETILFLRNNTSPDPEPEPDPRSVPSDINGRECVTA